MKHCTT